MKQQTPPLGIRMPDDLKMWIKMRARMDDRSMNNLIVHILRSAMEKDNAKA